MHFLCYIICLTDNNWPADAPRLIRLLIGMHNVFFQADAHNFLLLKTDTDINNQYIYYFLKI